jgi:Tol biopolymer transport system component
VGDRFERVDLPKAVTDAVGKTWVSFVNISDANPPGTPGTPVTTSNKESVYLVSPDGSNKLKVIDLAASTDRHIYWSPDGAYMAYFIPDGNYPGLYMLDLVNKTTTRLFEMTDINPRGFQVDPAWSPDGKQLTVALTTPYSVNVFSVAVDGTGYHDLSAGGSFDLWPVWSPDGAYLAFVSDRAKCPSWVPGEAETCYAPDAIPPIGGNLYVLDAVSHQVRLMSDQLLTSAPHWITATRLAFNAPATNASGDKTGARAWWVDLRGGPPHQVTDTDLTDSAQALREAWSPDGHNVVYQEVDATSRIVLRTEVGKLITHLDQFNFPRFGFSAAWSPDGKKVAIGGHNGQCPFGMLLTDDSLKVLVNSPPAPGICDPAWSPDGKYIAFSGITQSSGTGDTRDGRFDLYISEASGYATRNLTGKFGGQIRFLGWIKGN